MSLCRSLAVVAAALLAACAPPQDETSTFEEHPFASRNPAKGYTTSELPTEPAEPSKSVPADPCAFGTQTGTGCQVAYAIDVEAAAAHLPKLCAGGTTAYNDCSGAPIELTWKDVGDRVPTAAKIEIGVSIFCADPLIDASYPQRQGVSVNGGATVGGFDGDLSACSCDAKTTVYAFEAGPESLADYHAGGENTVIVQGPNRCIGVGSLDGGPVVARVVVTY